MSKKQIILFVRVIAMISSVCFFGAWVNNVDANEHHKEESVRSTNLLVSTEWLEKNKDVGIIIDSRKDGYEAGHIPGAVPLPYTQLVDPNHPIKGHLISKDQFEKKMKQLGIRNDQTVVLYDDGDSPHAARVFFALEYYGHQDVRLLDGGLQAWKESGRALSQQEVPKEKTGNFKAIPQSELLVDKEFVKSAIRKENFVILDVRSPEEYRGEDVQAKRGGHIPTAVNFEWKRALEQEGVPYFKPIPQLEQQFREVGVTQDKNIIIFCQSAVRSSHTYFVLRLLGFQKLHVYEGSWADWGNDPNAPIEKP